jgi:electron transport complex protein RnfG
MKEVLKLSIALGVICGLAASVLALAEWQTQEPRQRAETAQRQEALKLVLPDYANDALGESQSVDGVTFYPARDADGRLLAVAGEGSSGKGFGGMVSVLVSFTPEGRILHVLVTGHKETPGLGTQVTDRRRKRFIWEAFKPEAPEATGTLPPNRYLDDFNDRQAQAVGSPEFHVVKTAEELGKHSILAVSGATVSSRAVQDAVSRVAGAFAEYRAGSAAAGTHN